MTKSPLVSIIIPTHNRKDMVVRLIKSIMMSSYKNIEIIVVDDASTDGTSEQIKKFFLQVNRIYIVRNKVSLFAAGSRNVGTRKSTGEYIFYIDDDNVIDKYAIEKLVKYFEEDKYIGELGLVNYSYSDKEKILWLFTGRNMLTSKTFLPNNFNEFNKKELWDTADVPNAFMVRSKIVKQQNISFCDYFEIMYEESDFAYRIRKAGYKIQVVRDAKIYHDVKNYMPHFMNDKRRLYVFARNRIIFHSLYSNKVELLSILFIWIWVFTVYYVYKILSYSGEGNFSSLTRFSLINEYLKGNIIGLLFVLGRKKLNYL
jgi:GT2 family glycosyltransferase